MKTKLITTLFLIPSFLPITSTAQQSMTQQDMMQQMQAVGQCMEAIDKKDMQKFEHEGTQMSDQIQNLCSQGKKSQAQDLAIDFSKKMKKSKILVQMQGCMDKIPPSMRAMIPQISIEKALELDTKTNICDQE